MWEVCRELGVKACDCPSVEWHDLLNPGSLSFLASTFSLLCGCILCGIGYILCNLSISLIRKTKVTQG